MLPLLVWGPHACVCAHSVRTYTWNCRHVWTNTTHTCLGKTLNCELHATSLSSSSTYAGCRVSTAWSIGLCSTSCLATNTCAVSDVPACAPRLVDRWACLRAPTRGPTGPPVRPDSWTGMLKWRDRSMISREVRSSQANEAEISGTSHSPRPC